MTTWRDALQPAKFRNAGFLYADADGTLGRRVHLHEYPGRDLPFAEDLGRKARQWTMNIFVIGAGYMAERDALVAALEQTGPGTLQHPYLGPLQVAAVDVQGPRESTRHGGMASFRVTFVEAGDNSLPVAATDHQAVVSARADAAQAAAVDDFVRAYTLDGQPGWVAAEALTVAGGVLAGIARASALIPAIPGAVTSFVADLGAVGGALSALVRQPAGLASSVLGLIRGLAGLPAGPLNALAVYRGLWPFGHDAGQVVATTPARKQQAANQEAMLALVRRGAVIEAARVMPVADFASLDDAVLARDQVAEALDMEMAEAGDDLYTALESLRVAVVRDIAARPGLLRLMRITPHAGVPALVLAYQLYADATRCEDLVRRNHIRHPGFIPAGQTLEVLADA